MVDPSHTPAFRFDAFISYTRADGAFARSLQRDLETRFRSLKLRGGEDKRLNLFRDETDLTASGNLLPALLERIHESKKMLVICSPASRKAPWVDQEIEGYRSTHGTEGNEGIVAVLLAGDEPVRDTALPAALTRDGQEPLAVEFRSRSIEPDQNYKKYVRGDGLLRILAPLLDVEYPELKNRHLEYEKQRLRRNVLVAGVLAVVFALLSAAAFLAYREADRQKSIAFSNLNDALMAYAVAARLELNNGDLDQAGQDFSYIRKLGRSLPMEYVSFALLWSTFADDFLRLGDAYAAARRLDRAEVSYKVAMQIWDTLIQTTEREAGRNEGWKAFTEQSVEGFGRPGEIYMLKKDDGGPKVIDQWRSKLNDVSNRLVRLDTDNQE